MHVYTYHEPVQGLEDPSLLHLFEATWRRNGFTPKVLCRADAEKHPRFSEIDHFRGYFAGSGTNPEGYQLACIARWAAFASVEDPYVLAADWDVMNVGFRWESEPKIVNFGDQSRELVIFSPSGGELLCPAVTFCARSTAERVLDALLSAAASHIRYGECHDEDILRHAPHGIPIWHVPEAPNRGRWHTTFSASPRLIHFTNGTTPYPRSATIRAELGL